MTIKALQIICLVLLAILLTACPKPALKGAPAEIEEPAVSEEVAEEDPTGCRIAAIDRSGPAPSGGPQTG